MLKTAFVFPGQGSQSVGMGKDLFEGFNEVRDLYTQAGDTLGYDIADLSFHGPEAELNRTLRTQPCLLTASMASLAAISLFGVKPDVVAGHSLGEYSALVASGVLSFTDALKTTELRARLMEEATPVGFGMMAAVLGLDRATVKSTCASVQSGYVEPANYNCPGQVVISGERQAVQEAMIKLKEAGAKKVIGLQVSVPSHCKLMDGASKKLSEFLFLGEIEMNEPKIPIVSNADAIYLSSIEGIKAALVNQLNSTVLWENSIIAMAEDGVNTFIEVGPGKVLSGLIKRITPDAIILNVQDRDSLKSTLQALGI